MEMNEKGPKYTVVEFSLDTSKCMDLVLFAKKHRDDDCGLVPLNLGLFLQASAGLAVGIFDSSSSGSGTRICL